MDFHILVTVCDGNPYDNECCSAKHQCEDSQGDCDSDDECKGDDLLCGIGNCPDHIGFSPGTDCCEHKGRLFLNMY